MFEQGNSRESNVSDVAENPRLQAHGQWISLSALSGRIAPSTIISPAANTSATATASTSGLVPSASPLVTPSNSPPPVTQVGGIDVARNSEQGNTLAPVNTSSVPGQAYMPHIEPQGTPSAHSDGKHPNDFIY
jgi:hypothetical protein